MYKCIILVLKKMLTPTYLCQFFLPLPQPRSTDLHDPFPTAGKGKISMGVCGRFTLAELVSVTISVGVVCVWVLTGHWALMDFLGMGLCVAFIAFVRLPSLKVSTLLLTGLLLYDVFWVFFSQVKYRIYFSGRI